MNSSVHDLEQVPKERPTFPIRFAVLSYECSPNIHPSGTVVHPVNKKKAAQCVRLFSTNYNPMNISKINSLVFYLVFILEVNFI